jgi:hypothetical protein
MRRTLGRGTTARFPIVVVARPDGCAYLFLYVGLPSPTILGLNEETKWLVSESCAATNGAEESRKSAVASSR